MDDFNDRVAVVTGAASGIGRSVAERLVAAGAAVVLGDVAAEGVRAVAKALGERAHAVTCDVTDAAQVEAVAMAVDAFGHLDVTSPSPRWHARRSRRYSTRSLTTGRTRG
jgi:NAD(P)-dependent dehydrogenase (short-subunit alcohol dehydrogenase family)